MTQADFQISGVSATAQNSNFSDGTAKITDGEGIDDSDKGTNNVVIDSTLAETNDLAVEILSQSRVLKMKIPLMK